MEQLIAFFIAWITAWLNPLPSPLPSPMPKPEFALVEIDRQTNLRLVANFDQPQRSEELKWESGCQVLINAGFYTPERKPIGWWESEGVILGNVVENELFNGFIYGNNQGTNIAKQKPTASVTWGVQSGPILIWDEKLISLKIRNDQLARRMVMGINDQSLVFLGVEQALLAKLPQVVESLAQQKGIKLTRAINLDGGSASAFISPDILWTEINPIGSFLCLIS